MGSRGMRSLSGFAELKRRMAEDKEMSKSLREAVGALGTPATIEQAMRRANEDLKSGSDAFSFNCYNVAVAYELQRRGYDVKAKGHNSKLNLGEMIYPKGEDAGFMVSKWTGAFRKAQFEHVGNINPSITAKNLTNKIKSYGNGARGAIQFDYVSAEFGHVLNFENRSGKPIFVDAQRGKQYTVSQVLKDVKTITVNIVRTDNLRLSDRAKKSVRKR